LGLALIASRKLREARKHLSLAHDLEPESSMRALELAHVHDLLGEQSERIALVKLARELEPDSPDAIVADGEIELERGNADAARQRAREALELEPEETDALVLMGRCELRSGNLDGAREHVRWALSNSPQDTGALHLLAGIKARENPLLGVWWRYNTWMNERGTGMAIFLLVGAYVVYGVSTQVLADLGAARASQAIHYGWLGFCVYTWFAPGLFLRAVRKEIGQVRLSEHF
jgi:tetratricopeptide (TPR) repeat protein